jgi:phage terminase small subunit
MGRTATKAKAKPATRHKAVKVDSLTDNSIDEGATVAKFIEYYWQWNHATKAAMAAGIAQSNARRWASLTLQLPAVQLALSRRRSELMQSTDWQTKDSLRELINVAMVDPVAVTENLQKAFNTTISQSDDGSFSVEAGTLTLDDIPPEVRRCVKKMKQGVAGIGEQRMIYIESIEFYDRLHAIEMLSKHIGFYEKDNEQKADAVALLLASLQTKNEGGKLVVAQ